MKESDILNQQQKDNHQKSNLSGEFLSSKNDTKPTEKQEAPINDTKPSKKPEDADVIQNLEKQITTLKENIVLLHADMENLRKRQKKEIENIAQFASSSLLKDLIEPFEQLFMAISSAHKHTDDSATSIINGIEITKNAFTNAFEKHGLVRIFPKGEKFDHNTHQAISQVQKEGADSGQVVDVVQAGYTLNGRIIKPAMVVVAL